MKDLGRDPAIEGLPENSIAPELETARSMFRVKDVRLAEGEPEGDAGELDTRDRRFVGFRAGAMGESQKKSPKPGEPEPNDAGPPNAGEPFTADARREGNAGESMSIPASDEH